MDTPNFETLGKRKSIQENLTPRTASGRKVTNQISKTATKSEPNLLKPVNSAAQPTKSSSVQNLTTLSKEQLKYVSHSIFFLCG